MNDKVVDESTANQDKLIGSQFRTLKRKYPRSGGITMLKVMQY